jgi:hypothetical protein
MVTAAQAQALRPNGAPVRPVPENIPSWTPDGQPAGWAELVKHYGTAEAAAYYSNALALQAQGRATQAIGAVETLQNTLAESWRPVVEWARALGIDLQREQVVPALVQALNEHLKMRLLLTDINQLSTYFLQLDDLHRQQNGQAPREQQAQTNGKVTNAPAVPPAVPQQLQTPMQQQMQNFGQVPQVAPPQQPTFPGGAGNSGIAGWDQVQNIPAHMRWKAIDQIGPDLWRQTRITF